MPESSRSSATSRAFYRRKRWLLLLLPIAFLVLLPFAVKYTLIWVLDDLLASDSSLEDVDLNLFSGKLELKKLDIVLHDEDLLAADRMAVDFGWRGLLNSEYLLEEIRIANAELTLDLNEDGELQILIPLTAKDAAADVQAQAETQTKALTLPRISAKEVTLDHVILHLRHPQLQGTLSIQHLSLRQLSSHDEAPAFLEIEADWNGAAIRVALNAELIRDIPQLNGQLSLSQLELQQFEPLVKSLLDEQQQQQLQDFSGLLSLDYSLDAKKLQGDDFSLQLDGALDLADVKVSTPVADVALAGFRHQGRTDLKLQDATPQVQDRASLSLAGFAIQSRQQPKPLLSLGALTLKELLVGPDLSVQLNQLGLDSLQVNLVLDQQGALQLPDFGTTEAPQPEAGGEVAQTESGAEKQAESGAEKEEGPAVVDADKDTDAAGQGQGDAAPVVALNGLSLQGDSFVSVSDARLQNPDVLKLQLTELTVNQLLPGRPDSLSHIELQGSLDEYSRLKVSGDVQPFAKKPSASMKGSVDELDLVQFSGYSEMFIGYAINTGQLNYRFELQLGNDQLDMSNKIVLHQFTIKQTDAEKSDALGDSLGVSLQVGLDMMRDKDDSIHLEVPIAGALDDLDVGIQSVLTSAMGKALTKGSLTYLQYAIQPYGAIMLAGNLINEQRNRFGFDPLEFAFQTTELPAEKHDLLDKIAGILNDRRTLSLKVCGYVSAEEAQQNDADTLKGWARQRSANVKRYLVEEKKVPSKQVVTCHVGSETRPKPVVELSI